MRHCWRGKDEFIRDGLVWTPLNGYASGGRPTRTLPQKLCTDTGYNLEDLPEVKEDKDLEQERIKHLIIEKIILFKQYIYSVYRHQYKNHGPLTNIYMYIYIYANYTFSPYQIYLFI